MLESPQVSPLAAFGKLGIARIIWQTGGELERQSDLPYHPVLAASLFRALDEGEMKNVGKEGQKMFEYFLAAVWTAKNARI
jgi:hypothetical protein